MSYYVPRTQKAIFGNAWAWIIGCLVVVALIFGCLWAFTTALSPIFGKAGAYRQQQAANNRVFAQQLFEQESADYDGYLAKIKTYTPPLSDTQRVELEGLRQQCINVAQNYNADSKKYLLRDFKAFDLPPRLDASAC